jgi:hypothetical protein
MQFELALGKASRCYLSPLGFFLPVVLPGSSGKMSSSDNEFSFFLEGKGKLVELAQETLQGTPSIG